MLDGSLLESNELEKVERPTLNDTEDMINVDMNSFGITSASSKNPVLKTVGLGPCVCVCDII